MTAARVSAETTKRAQVMCTVFCAVFVLLFAGLALGADASLPTLNMPNLNSAGGSWVVNFAELRPAPNSSGEFSPPVATLKVDPGYPMQLMRQNVSGTVILNAVIHADGTVGNVQVLSNVDPRLDRLASSAVGQWQFLPAMKNGSPVEVAATFKIPFRPSAIPTGY